MSVRRLPLAVGLLALLAGAAMVLGLLPTLPEEARSLPFVVVVLAGALLGAAATFTRAETGPRSEPLPAPERAADAGTPGAAIDRRLARIESDDEARAALEERLEAIAVATITRTEGCSPTEARDRLADGTWTDDERAAAFFATDPPAPAIGDHLRSLATGVTPTRRRATHAIDELHERRGQR